jgi:hypothetical protein
MAQQTKMEQSEQFSKWDEIMATLCIGALYTGLMLILYEIINFLFVNVFLADNQVHGKDKDTLYHLLDTAYLVQHTHKFNAFTYIFSGIIVTICVIVMIVATLFIFLLFYYQIKNWFYKDNPSQH